MTSFRVGMGLGVNHTKLIIVEDRTPLELVLVRNLSVADLCTFNLDTETLDELVDIVEDTKMRDVNGNGVFGAKSTFFRRAECMLLVILGVICQTLDFWLDMKELLNPRELFRTDYVAEPDDEESRMGIIKCGRHQVSVV